MATTRPSMELMHRLLAKDLAAAQGAPDPEAELQAVLLRAFVVARLAGCLASR